MLSGTASVDDLAGQASSIPAWSPHPTRFENVLCFQLLAELRRTDRASFLPPGLHPTDPPTLSIQAWAVESSPWGAFSWAFARLSCRSGVRARGLTTAAVASTDAASTGLASAFGFPCRSGSVHLVRHYDGVELDVDGTLRVRSVDARPLALDDVQYTGTMNLAHTPLGVRLVQVETEHEPTQVDRTRARIERFDPTAWGGARIEPYNIVAATISQERALVIPALRFVCRPDVSAFEGTERIG